MSVNHPQPDEDPFEITPGCPTLTYIIDKQEHAIPYHSFQQADLHGDTITVIFESGTLGIIGRNLKKLWRHLQMHDVRTVKCQTAAGEDAISISSINWAKKRSKAPSDDQMELSI